MSEGEDSKVVESWYTALRWESVQRYGMQVSLQEHLGILQRIRQAIDDGQQAEDLRVARKWGEFYFDKFVAMHCTLEQVKRLHEWKLLGPFFVPESNCDLLHLAAGACRIDLCEWMVQTASESKRMVSPSDRAMSSALCEVVPSLVEKIQAQALPGPQFSNPKEMAQWLFKMGGRLNEHSHAESTALYEIFVQKEPVQANLDYAQFLIGHGADVNFASRAGYTPLMACVAGEFVDYEGVEWLLKRGADPAIRLRQSTGYKLDVDLGLGAFVIRKGGLPALQRLSEMTRLNPAQDPSVLHVAIEEGDSRVVKFLLDAGADPNGWMVPSKPHLMHAITKRHMRIARMLLEGGANPNGPQSDLIPEEAHPMVAAALAEDVQFVKDLFAAGAWPPARVVDRSFAQTIAKAPKDVKEFIKSMVAKKVIETNIQAGLEGAFGAPAPAVVMASPKPKRGLSL